jgi:hypothetical protein
MTGVVVGGGTIAATGATISGMAYAGAPWWAIAAVATVFVLLGAVVGLVQALVPQDSGDRLEWWRDRRRHQTRLGARVKVTPQNLPGAKPVDQIGG